ncbi:uncharacterized LabA/DUF88 family protein [Oxalobacteraceae bacterium GrIS 2.11]
MQDIENISRTTAVYIDGYNLYYGRLRGTSLKWLDVMRLFQNLLTQRDQNESVERITIFTAHTLATFASHGQKSAAAQATYHRALKILYPDKLEIVYGKHSFDKNGALLPLYDESMPYDRNKRVRVWKLEEKKTDVNLALGMYRDAVRGLYDRIILVSNDSDVEPALQLIRQDFPHIMIGVVMPIHPPESATGHRSVSGSLVRVADWVEKFLTDDQLVGAQLPPKIPTRKKPILKPEHWSK